MSWPLGLAPSPLHGPPREVRIPFARGHPVGLGKLLEQHRRHRHGLDNLAGVDGEVLYRALGRVHRGSWRPARQPQDKQREEEACCQLCL